MKRPKKSEHSSSDRAKGKSNPRNTRDANSKGDKPDGRKGAAKAPYSSDESQPKKFTYTRTGKKNSEPSDSKDSKSAESHRVRKDNTSYSRPEGDQAKKGKSYKSTSKENSPRSFKGKEASRPEREKRDLSKTVKGKSDSGKKDSKKPSGEPSESSTSGLIRLNKFIADAGICSRREADQLIVQGEITVNGEVVTTMGVKVSRQDDVRYNGSRLRAEKLVYVLLNKPKDFITTTDDPENRRTVMDLIKNACEERIYPVGRLDRNTTGLLLFTNDGELAKTLSHPSGNVRKIYKVELDKPLTKVDFNKIAEGVELEDGPAKVDEIAALTSDMLSVGVELHSGRNRIVRRIFETLGYEVIRLDRVVYASLDKQMLPRGKWRFLTDREISKLKRLQR